MLTGIEATTINREPDNPWRKVSMCSTFKNRPDTDYFSPLPDPANMGSQALRIESQPGTGFERGIVFAPIALHRSRTLERPVAIDFSKSATKRSAASTSSASAGMFPCDMTLFRERFAWWTPA